MACNGAPYLQGEPNSAVLRLLLVHEIAGVQWLYTAYTEDSDKNQSFRELGYVGKVKVTVSYCGCIRPMQSILLIR
jgi:hypothetical protein